jgi:hypothetical protein
LSEVFTGLTPQQIFQLFLDTVTELVSNNQSYTSPDGNMTLITNSSSFSIATGTLQIVNTNANTINTYFRKASANAPATVGNLYNIQSDGLLTGYATIKVNYSSYTSGITNGSQLQLYLYDSPSKSFILVPSSVDAINQVVTAQISQFGTYAIIQQFTPFENIPDIKLPQGKSVSNLLNLNQYSNNSTLNWTWYRLGNLANININSYTNLVSYETPSMISAGMDTVVFEADTSNEDMSLLKYSSYILSPLPRVVDSNGTIVENQSLNLLSFVYDSSSSVPPTWSITSVNYENTNDVGKVSPSISNNALNLGVTSELSSPVEITIEATGGNSTTDWDKSIISIYEVLNNYGLFNTASDTTQWVYENAPNTSVMPTVGYLNTYNGASGVMDVSFTGSSQGIKMTLEKSNWLTSSTGQWYTIRMKIMADSSNDFIPELFIYNGVPGNPFGVSGAVLLSIPTTWTWMETAVYCDFTASLYPQVIIKNSSSTGNVYIDAVEIIQAEPGIQLAYGNTQIANPDGDWQNAGETTGWGFEPAPNAVLANYSASGGALDVFFDGTTTEGIKMTGATAPHVTATSPVASGISAGMKMNLSTSGTMDNPIFLLAVFGTGSQGGQNFNELGASAAIWYVPSSGQLETSYLPYQPYIYGQVQVKNSGNGIFYLNNTYLQADMDIPYYWDHSLFE